MPHHLRGQDGRVLSRWGEPVWGALVADGKSLGWFDDTLVEATVELVTQRWPEAANARWVTCIPSLRHPGLVPDFARRVAEALGLTYREVIRKVRETDPQKQMENRFYQSNNLDGAFVVDPELCYCDPVLLIDDAVDSAWTLTLASVLLREAGVNAVLPFALASTIAK